MNTVMLVFAILGMSGGTEWLVVGLAILLLFGGRKIPELMRGLGGGIKEFKNATKEDNSSDLISHEKEKKNDSKS
ncbi:MAG: twin-arginine translocase TatA/TatE family subunit [Flavobacteriales bacterium]|nr:twin-arginine translocase TatA/TatE family subunit [Flavobacteriales bacterium]|tara:strand:- start:6609 stop:6833 length:225 start_codon:yes stop_codon:yes gene_type:complete